MDRRSFLRFGGSAAAAGAAAAVGVSAVTAAEPTADEAMARIQELWPRIPPHKRKALAGLCEAFWGPEADQ